MISINDYDKSAGLKVARDLHRMGFKLYATQGTADFFGKVDLPVEAVQKIGEGSTAIVDLIKSGKVQFILNTPLGTHAHSDGAEIRATTIAMNIPLLTTLSVATAAVAAIQALNKKELRYRSLQSHFGKKSEGAA